MCFAECFVCGDVREFDDTCFCMTYFECAPFAGCDCEREDE